MDPVHHPTPPSSAASQTELDTITGPMTLAEFIERIEELLAEDGHHVQQIQIHCLRGVLDIFNREVIPPIVDPNLSLSEAIEFVVENERQNALQISHTNQAIGHHRVSPKRIAFGTGGSFNYEVRYGPNWTAHTGTWRPNANE